eukprot:scaffold21095_cov129-Isochrysis_galbana.AAC.5
MNNHVILLEDGWNKLKTGGVLKIEEILEDAQGGVCTRELQLLRLGLLSGSRWKTCLPDWAPSGAACSSFCTLFHPGPAHGALGRSSMRCTADMPVFGFQDCVYDVHAKAAQQLERAAVQQLLRGGDRLLDCSHPAAHQGKA